jgi:oxalate decarboxylase/phosphoglucose isomerase-like protein (cupin superfamily)
LDEILEEAKSMAQDTQTAAWGRRSAYQQWLESTGIPVHRGYFVEDLRTLPLGYWEERECPAAFIELAGQQGVTEGRVTEIPPGKTLPSVRFALDEAVYVVEGRGLATVWAPNRPQKTFEWQKHSLFLLPRGYHHQFTNTQGNAPARLLHYNALPQAMAITPDPKFFFENPYIDESLAYGESEEFYSEAKVMTEESAGWQGGGRAVWYGNFFPDMRAWDRLIPFRGRGAGGHVVWIQYPKSSLSNHMSVFPAKTYKKAHRHGPGVQIVIPSGEGYSVMWPEGEEKVIIPWHEASVFVPPNRWFHQHFNLGGEPARYLAFHAPRGVGQWSERVEDRQRDQIEYPDQEPFIRERFESELAKRGLKSDLPEIAYQDRNFEWEYGQD